MMRTMRFLTPALLLLAGCSAFWDLTGLPNPADTTPPGGGTTDTAKAGLKQFGSASEFQAYFTSQVAADRGNGLSDSQGTLDGTSNAPTAADESGATPGPAGSEGGGGGTRDGHSDTTTQEEGVQESDIIKNDGQYIYVLTTSYNPISSVYTGPTSTLRIVQADPGASLAEVGGVDLDGYGQELYLFDNKVIALTVPTSFVEGPAVDGAETSAPPMYFQPRVLVTVIDVTDHAAPAVASSSWFEGNLSSSRMIDQVLHLVIVNYPDFFMPLMDIRGGIPVVQDNLEVTTILPKYEVTVAGQDPVSGNMTEATDVYYPVNPDGYGMTTVLSLDIADPAGFDAVGILAYPGNVYASTSALYLTNSDYMWFWGDSTTEQTTDIYKFDFTTNGPALKAVGTVPGRVLNQYSMSEYEGYLRVATTVDATGWFEEQGAPSTNHVYVLGQDGENLNIVGRLENIAEGEMIYSARFSGPRGYLVTFEQTDPLFTMDLSNPTSPQMVGRLEVPGFSTFIIELDANHLLTIGQDAHTTEDGFTIPEGVQLSIFDISDFAHPQLLFAPEKIGEPDAWSEALYNPKALTYFAEQNLLALPIEIVNWNVEVVDGGGATPVTEPNGPTTAPAVADAGTNSSDESEVSTNGDDGTDDTSTNGDVEPVEPTDPTQPEGFRGLYVYRVTTAGGFQFLGRINTEVSEDWWNYPSFTRGVFMNGNVFAVTDLSIGGAPVETVTETPAWSVAFPNPYPDIFVGEGDGGTTIAEPRPADEVPSTTP